MYMVQRIARDGKVPLTVVRDGKEVNVQLPVSPDYDMLIPDLGNSYPSYFIYGPLVFSTATEQFMRGFGGNRAARWLGWLSQNRSPLVARATSKVAFEGEQLVVVPAPFFPHKLATGYDEPYFQVVKTVNNVPIKNLTHLVELLRDSKDEYITVEFDSRAGEALVFVRKEMVDATEEILNDNGIRSQGSPDTLAIWNAGTAR
jgi:hypothetical protein